MSLLPASQLTPQIIDWLWPKRLPAGNLALLDGHPGLGKSWVMLDLCARISTGRAFPDGAPSPGPANCLIINGDNPRESVVLPRLIQLGADLRRIFIAPAYRNPEDYRWPKKRKMWAKHLRDHRPVLTIVDPLFAFLASTTAYVDERLRAVLVPLRDLAEEFRTVMLMSRHLGKSSSGPAVTLGLGGMGLSGSCPTVWLAARDPANPERCILAESKNNYGPGLQPSLGYSLARTAEAPAPPDGERAEVRRDEQTADNCKLQIENCKLQIEGDAVKADGPATDAPAPPDGERTEDYSRDPRNVARKAVNYMKSSGIADVAYFGPELEFFIFDDVRFDQTTNCGYYFIDSEEGAWNTGKSGGNLGYKIRPKEGYFPVPPADTLQDMRTEMMLHMMGCGIAIEAQHHEVATAGQAEIDMKFSPLVEMGDKVMKYKYIIKNTAKKYGKTVTFMPKPLYADNGSGMHVHVSLWKNNVNLFAGSGYAGLSEMGLYAIGGLLKHAPAICGFANPTTNSYKRLVPGYEAPVNLAYSRRNRSAACRIPMYSANPKAKRVEFRCPDPSSNPYFTFSVMLMAALDGIKNKIKPGEPLDRDIYDMEPEELAKVPKTPGALHEALDALEQDHEFLLQGDVFTKDVIHTWLDYKRTKEVDAIRLRPHPYEFFLYYDV